MNLEETKALVHKHDDDIINKYDLTALDRDVAPNAVDHAAAPGTAPGIEGAREQLTHLLTAFPDMSASIDDSSPKETESSSKKLGTARTKAPSSESSRQAKRPALAASSFGASKTAS